MFGFDFKLNEIKRLTEEIENLKTVNKNLNEENILLRKEKENVFKVEISNYLKDSNIDEFMKTIQLMAKEKIKNNDDVYLVGYYVDLYKFIDDLKRDYR